jgi:hypothetical protein
MTITIKNNAQSWDESFLDELELKNTLTDDEYEALLDFDGQLDEEVVWDKYGARFAINETWLEIYIDEEIILEIKSREILDSLFYFPNQFEGIETEIINDTFIAITACVAQGQGGGFAIIDIENKRWICSTNDGFRNDFTFIQKHGVFLSIGSVSTYTWYGLNLTIIDMFGRIAYLDLYHCVNDLESFERKIENNLEELGFIRIKTKPDTDNKSFYHYFYYSENDEIYLSINDDEHFVCDFIKIMNLTEFQS